MNFEIKERAFTIMWGITLIMCGAVIVLLAWGATMMSRNNAILNANHTLLTHLALEHHLISPEILPGNGDKK